MGRSFPLDVRLGEGSDGWVCPSLRPSGLDDAFEELQDELPCPPSVHVQSEAGRAGIA